ncbi:PKD domain-containing protein [Flavihumibacter rivuli]|uniref:PKD domain-containing protein n=1 Tax=Flavihumibacter rivuli TaxID=2838156 RepID=UPI001BDEBD92|nr:PKD domain-containing protein [Flavihumibacter rivuli]ULQ57956.1 PKD domain-containing protein [Flavihumibacter rivuli]
MKRFVPYQLRGVLCALLILLLQAATPLKAQTGVKIISDFEGTTFNSGWEYFHACCSYSMNLDKSVVRSGTQAVRMELRDTDPLIASGTRAELVFNYKLKDPQWKWYQFSTYFPADFKQDNVYEIISQWHYEPTGGGSTFSPPMALTIRNGNWYLDLRYDSTDINIYGNKNVKQQYIDLGTWKAGEWTDWVVYYSPSWQTDGIVRIWKNGVKILDRIGRNFYLGALPPYWKIGIYKWVWNSGTSLTSSRVVYYDRVKVGNDNATLNDFITGAVDPSPTPTNQAPTANAGANIAVTLPANTATLNGGNSTDADGSIVKYNWRQVSGPNTATISDANLAKTTIGNLVMGTYTFRLTVTDDKGATATDDISVLVNEAVITNQAPVANAGGNQTIHLPQNALTLSGSASSDPDGSIASYLWRQVSGPSTATLTSANTVNLTASNLVRGNYSFSLQVTDNKGATGSTTVWVTVNQPPVAEPGSDKTIYLPNDSIALSGSASTDIDGTITTYAWRQLSGPAAASFSAATGEKVTVSKLIEGTYTIQLTVTDNRGGTSSKNINVTVRPQSAAAEKQAPVANAGSKQTVIAPKAVLDGVDSYDPDGQIVTYAWSQVSGPNQAVIANPGNATTEVSNLVPGTYSFKLEVKDNDQLTGAATMIMEVSAAPINGKAPIANAGVDQNIQLPDNTTSVDGKASSDPDGSIRSYSWSQVAGPAGANINNPNAVKTRITNLKEGFYLFQLEVTDNSGLKGRDTLRINVIPQLNQAPVAVTEAVIEVQLPVNEVDLNGEASYDPDGKITMAQWKMVNGPSNIKLTNSNSPKAKASGLVPGTYTFQLTLKDDKGAVNQGTVSVVVKGAMGEIPTAAFKTFPNPVQSNMTLKWDDQLTGKAVVKIYTITGVIVYKDEFTKTGTSLTRNYNLANLVAGSYVLSLQFEDQQPIIKKFQKL